jgi:hypothetical protein
VTTDKNNDPKDEKWCGCIIDDTTASYLAKLLKTDKKIIKKITDNRDDIILISQQASKKRLNKRKLAAIHPKMASLLMVFREGEKIGASFNENIYSSEMLYRFFFKEEIKLNLERISKSKNLEDAAQACLIIKIFLAESIETYCEENKNINYLKTLNFLNECIKKGFKDCKSSINMDNCKKTLEEVKEKYL